jgi:hypothetical protein
MRLNGWQRTGIAISVAWFLVGGFLGNNAAINEATKLTNLQEHNCIAVARAGLHLNGGDPEPFELVYTPCREQFEKNYLHNVKGHWWAALISGLAPIPLGWLVAWGLIALYRWIRAGFDGERIPN